MKPILYILLYLNIYTGFYAITFSQELRLQVVSENENNNRLLDSLGYVKKMTDYKSLVNEVQALKKRLQEAGYVNAKVISTTKLNDTTFVSKINIGDAVLRYVIIQYDSKVFSIEELALISDTVTGDFFVLPFDEITQSLDKLIRIKTNQGFAFSNLKLDSIRMKSSDTLISKLILSSSNKRVIDSIVLKGYSRFSKSYLKYFLGIKKGDLFSKETLVAKTSGLNALPFVSAAKPPEVLFTDDSTIAYFYLKKEQANVFDGIIGFSTDEKTNKLQFNGYLDLLLINNLNYGEEFGLHYKADGNDQQNFRVRAKMPYLFKTPVGVELQLAIFKRDSSFVTTNQKVVTSFQINKNLVSLLGYQIVNSTNLLESNLNNQIEDFNSSSWMLGMSYKKTQDQVFFPIKTKIDLSVRFGSRENVNFSDKQVIIESRVENIFILDNKNAIFVSNTSAYLSSSVYLENELFRFGGIESLRGFVENAIDASVYSLVNTEYRYVVNSQLYLHSVFDAGYFEDATLKVQEKLFSVGLGLGLQTSSSLMRIILANGSVIGQNFKASNTKIHLQFVQSF